MKQVEGFIRRKKSAVRVDRHMGGLREQFESLSWGISSGFPLTDLCLVLSLYLVYLRVLPCVHVHLLANMDSSEEAYG